MVFGADAVDKLIYFLEGRISFDEISKTGYYDDWQENINRRIARINQKQEFKEYITKILK
ncbi:MAG: hypothetical protein ACRC18_06580 [Cetobacterium sp.]